MNNKFNNGFKTVAVLMQMVFLIIVIVVFSLMVNLFGRNRLSFRDIGNNYSFFHSYYYVEEISEEIKDLMMYLQMERRVEEKVMTEPQNTKYKMYKVKFEGGLSNLYYWFLQENKVYTNMKDISNKEEAVRQAKKLGNYLCYDDALLDLKGNLKYLDQLSQMDVIRLFQAGGTGCLIIGVDTSLSKADAIANAAVIYDTYVPWIGVSIFVAIVAFLSFLLTMIYITLATGRSDKDDSIHLHRIDYLPTELLFAAAVIFMTGLILFCAKLGDKEWGISSSLILTGTLVFLSDAVLLTLYMSFVRKIKADLFTKCSLVSYVIRIYKKSMKEQAMEKRGIIRIVVCMAMELFFLWKLFFRQSVWAVFGLLALFVYSSVTFMEHTVFRKKILDGIREISHGKLEYKLDLKEYKGDYKELAEEINGIGEGLLKAVEENVKSERLKTELVTNVSHDIKTPLTSIINYISLIKMEGCWNENVENYVEILDKKSQRLKQLTEDLVEVSQITSGNIILDMQPINMVELIFQTGGEFNEIFEDVGLTVVTRLPKEPVMILADGSRVWRVVQNLYNNVAKYAMKDTRVFVELKVENGIGEFSIKDICAQSIHKPAQDLSERFVRGDESRGTEGNGLGLSIARNLTNLMGGTFEIKIDGDLFIVSITFPVINP